MWSNKISNDSMRMAGDPMSSWWPYIIATFVALISVIRQYAGGRQYISSKRMDGKVVIITGANSGIGYETALDMARRGATVVMACRDLEAGQRAADRMRKSCPDATLDVRRINLASQNSVVEFVHSLPYQSIDVLVNNAGIAFQPFALNEDGFEMHFATNYLGHFLLTRLLVPRMISVPGARVISMSSKAHVTATLDLNNLNLTHNYSAKQAYAQSKLCLILMTRFLGYQLKDTNINFLAIDPGVVRGTKHIKSSPIMRFSVVLRVTMFAFLWLFMKNAKQASQTVICAILDSQFDETCGVYMSDCRICPPSPVAKDDKLATDLFKKSLHLIGVNPTEPSQ